MGCLVAQTDPANSTTLTSYNATGWAATQAPLGNTTGYGCDAAGWQVQTSNPATGTVQITYDAADNTIAVTTDRTAGNAPVIVDQMGYDALDRAITSTVVTDTANVAGSALTTLGPDHITGYCWYMRFWPALSAEPTLDSVSAIPWNRPPERIYQQYHDMRPPPTAV